MSAESRVLCIGEPLLGLVAQPPGPFEEARYLEPHVVGAESNVAVGLARLCHPTAMLAVIGDDGPGRIVRRRLMAEGVDTSGLSVSSEMPTGLLLREVQGFGASEVIYRRSQSAGASLSPDHVEAQRSQITRTSWLVTSGVTLAISSSAQRAATLAIELVHAAGGHVCLDVNYRSKLWPRDRASDAIRNVLDHVTLLLAGADELELLTEESDPKTAALDVLSKGPSTVVVKLGADGALMVNDRGCWHSDAPRARVVDAVGAGDAFAAGLLSGILDSIAPEDQLVRANLCAGYVLSATGDIAGLPRRGQLTHTAIQTLR